jgi:hypothetical protein
LRNLTTAGQGRPAVAGKNACSTIAVTRAKQELYLTFPVMARDRGGLDILMEPSRFIRELLGARMRSG